MNEIVFLIIGLAAGFGLGFLLAKLTASSSVADNTQLTKLQVEKEGLERLLQQSNGQLQQLQIQLEDFRNKNTEIEKELANEKGKIDKSREVFLEQKSKLEEFQKRNEQLNNDNSTYSERIKNLEKQLEEQRKQADELQQKFTKEFENLANKILDEKTQKFTTQNKEQLGQIIAPFQEKIKEFEKKVEETYQKGRDQSVQLFEQIKNLSEINNQMRNEAQNLANALRGDKKTQGNWGEFILEKVLERSGLQKGIEYEMQFSTTNTEGSRVQPDVVVKLPENKHIIIDSKVSLNAYNDWVNEKDETLKEGHLKNLISNTRNHIKTLSDKSYHQAIGINSPEFVLMFVPVEASFSTMIQNDNDLWNYGWERKIIIVSPSTLLATLRTIASVWKQEKQNANAIEIAKRAGDMYDKFVGFLDDMMRIGNAIDQSNNAYHQAMNKLKEGKGNLISRAENLKELGAKADKTIQQKLIDQGE
jgi:DNA recombination protein RmuC